jgi:hypothetical protein
MKKTLHKPCKADVDIYVNIYGGDICSGNIGCGLEW